MQYENLEQLILQSQKYDDLKMDLVCQMKDLEIQQNGIEILGETYRWENLKNQPISYGKKDFGFPNEFAFRQLFGLMRPNETEIKSPTQILHWLKGESEDIAFHSRLLINSFLRDNPDKKLLIRFYDNEPRAILSGQYSDFPNTEILIALHNRIAQGGIDDYLMPRPYLSPDKAIITIVSPNGTQLKEGDKLEGYGGGFGFSNDETGIGALKLGGVLWRFKCLNSIRFSSQERIIHKHHALSSIVEKVNVEVKLAFEEIGNWYETVTKASQIAIGDLSRTLNKLEQSYPIFSFSNKKIGQSYRDIFVRGMEGSSSLMGLFNGGSSLAHKIENPQEGFDMELAIGDLFQKVLHDEEISILK